MGTSRRTTSSITMQSLGEIVQRAPAVGAKMWCLFVAGRIAAKRQTAGIKFTHKPKIRFSPPQGDSLHRFMSNLALVKSRLAGVNPLTDF